MREGTTSRVITADRPYGVFYNFYSVNPEYFGYHHVVNFSELVAITFCTTDFFFFKSIGEAHDFRLLYITCRVI
jgi:hypothetical protein